MHAGSPRHTVLKLKVVTILKLPLFDSEVDPLPVAVVIDDEVALPIRTLSIVLCDLP